MFRTKDHIKFMKAVLPLLDAADYVMRYSWMAAKDSSGLRNLVEPVSSGSTAHRLTELGRIWNSGASE